MPAQLAIARLEGIPEERIETARRGGDNRRPITRGQELCRARNDLLLLGGKVVAVVHEVSRGSRLDRVTLDQRSLGRPLEDLEEPLAGRGDDAMLLEPPGKLQLERRIALDQAREGHVLAGMMEAVFVMVAVMAAIMVAIMTMMR